MCSDTNKGAQVTGMGDSAAREALGTTATINDISDEVLVKILSYSTSSQLIETISNVCRRWRRLSRDSELWRHKEFCVDRDVHLEVVVQRLRGLRSIVLKCRLKPPAITAIADHCPGLTSLKFTTSQCIGIDLLQTLVEKCPNIRFLAIPVQLVRHKRKAQAWGQLQKLKSLEVIKHNSSDSCVHLRPFADGCPEFAVLKLSRYVEISREDMEDFLIRKSTTLTNLTLPSNVCTRRCLELVNACASLFNLEIVAGKWGPAEDLSALSLLSNLRQLRIRDMHFFSSMLAATGFRSGGLLHLEVLEFSKLDDVEDEAVMAVCEGCPLLRELHLMECPQLTDQALSQFNRLSQLEVLSLTNCKGFREEAVPYVAQVTTLRNLSIDEMNLRKLRPGLVRLLDLAQLEVLSLNYVRQESIFPFHRLAESLRDLRILKLKGDIPRWEVMAVQQRLKQQIPCLEVHFENKIL